MKERGRLIPIDLASHVNGLSQGPGVLVYERFSGAQEMGEYKDIHLCVTAPPQVQEVSFSSLKLTRLHK